jgi:hypothetical protein
MTESPAKIAFLILSDDATRAVPGLVMAQRLKENRGTDVSVLFFGPGVKLAASGVVDEQLAGLHATGVRPTACSAQATQYGVADEFAPRQVELLAAGAEVQRFAREGYTVLSF